MNFKSYISPHNQTNLSEWTDKFLDNKIIFSFKFIKTHNKFCLSKSWWIKKDLSAIYKTLWEKESYTWGIFIQKPKSSWWLSRENVDSDNYKLLKWICPELNKFWHFYIKDSNSGVWRVFWWYEKGIFYIIYIDINWKINWSSHK